MRVHRAMRNRRLPVPRRRRIRRDVQDALLRHALRLDRHVLRIEHIQSIHLKRILPHTRRHLDGTAAPQAIFTTRERRVLLGPLPLQPHLGRFWCLDRESDFSIRDVRSGKGGGLNGSEQEK